MPETKEETIVVMSDPPRSGGRGGDNSTFTEWVTEKKNAELIADVLKDVGVVLIAGAGVAAAAGQIHVAIGLVIAAGLWLVAGDIWNYIASDPPQPSYMQEAQVVLTPISGFDKADDLRVVAEAGRDLLAWGRALLDSMERAQGAAIAGDAAWTKTHVDNFASEWKRLRQRLATQEGPLEAALRWLGGHLKSDTGSSALPAEKRGRVESVLRDFGYDDAMLRRFWSGVAAPPPMRRRPGELIKAFDAIIDTM